MPLVRVSGRDVENFDTFDVAEMTDDDQRNTWSSRQSQLSIGTAASRQSNGTGSSHSRHHNNHHHHAKNNHGHTPETDDMTSLDGSAERASLRNSYMPRGSSNSLGSMSMNSYSMSMNSYSVNSYSINSQEVHSHNSHNQAFPVYETVDNLDEMQHDPRNPFHQRPDSLRKSWGENIPEEDETSMSTMEESSVSPSVQQQQQQQQLSQSSHSQHRSSHRQGHRQRPPQSSSEGDDDSSVVSSQQRTSQPSRQDIINKRNAEKAQHMIQQLESLVAKVNLELAMTKSSLDELQLENRKLACDKEKLTSDVEALTQENERLHVKIEKMERSIILRNMEGTKGVASSAEEDSIWDGSPNSRSRSSNKPFVVKTKRLGKVVSAGAGGDGALEVPFRPRANDYHLRPKRASICSQTSFNELSNDDDNVSKGEISAASIDLDNDDWGGNQPGREQEDRRGNKLSNSLLGMMGVGREIVGQIEKMSVSVPHQPPPSSSRRSSSRDDDVDSGVPPPRRRTSSRDEDTLSILSERSNRHDDNRHDEDEIGSNPQGEGEDFNDDDPFSTWSAPGDPKRKEPEQNWLSRGLGGGGSSGGNGRGGKAHPQSDDIIGDPFDSCDKINEDEEYTSFADSASIRSGSNSGGDMQDRKRFGLFRGNWGGRRAK